MTEITTMVYGGKPEFKAYEGRRVSVFSFWHISGALYYDVYAVDDAYNIERMMESYTRLGDGYLHELIGKPTRLAASWATEWAVSWEREVDTPPNPFTLRWKIERRVYHMRVAYHLLRQGNLKLAIRRILDPNHVIVFMSNEQ